MFQIIVKGNSFEALAAAAKRNVRVLFKHEVFAGQQSVLMSDADEETLSKWLIEDVGVQSYPIGSLLHYQRQEYARVFLSPHATLPELDKVIAWLHEIGADPALSSASGGCYSVSCKVKNLPQWHATTTPGVFFLICPFGTLGVM